jgi:hypothetical protein
MPAPQPAGDACPLCGAPLHPEQEWCLRCGAAARTRLAAAPNWRGPIAALAVVLALSLGVLAAALISLAGSGGSATTSTTTVTTAPAPIATTPTPIPTPAPTATGTAPNTTLPGNSVPRGSGTTGTRAPGASTSKSPSGSTSLGGVSTPNPNLSGAGVIPQARLRELLARRRHGK